MDSGAEIRYDHLGDCFTMQSKVSTKTYRFGRKRVVGSEGRFTPVIGEESIVIEH